MISGTLKCRIGGVDLVDYHGRWYLIYRYEHDSHGNARDTMVHALAEAASELGYNREQMYDLLEFVRVQREGIEYVGSVVVPAKLAYAYLGRLTAERVEEARNKKLLKRIRKRPCSTYMERKRYRRRRDHVSCGDGAWTLERTVWRPMVSVQHTLGEKEGRLV